MSTELPTLEQQLGLLAPRLELILPINAGLSVQRLIRTVVFSCERNPDLLATTRESLIAAAWTAAVLGLEVDGVTGQGYLIPYKNRAQFQIGFKGYSTIAARSGFILIGGLIREGDEYDYVEGSGGHIVVHPKLGHRPDRRILAAWALAGSRHYPDVPLLMDIDEIEQVRKRSQAVQSGKPTPWNDWYGEMAIKTVKKRLCKSIPINLLQVASAVDDASATGQTTYLREDGRLMIEGPGKADVYPTETATAAIAPPKSVILGVIVKSGNRITLPTITQWQSFVLAGIARIASEDDLIAMQKRNQAMFDEIATQHPAPVLAVRDAIVKRAKELDKVDAITQP